MVLKVDLKCSKCYKKLKKVLCKFPQIQDQVFDEKQNTVTIKVVCCCPERMKQKIRCKGGKSIQSIEIKPPEKPKPTEGQKKEDKKEPEKKETEKQPKKDKPKVIFVDPPPQRKPQPQPQPPQPQPQPQPQTKPTEPAPPTKAPVAVPGYPPYYPNYPIGVCCRECSEGRRGGPCEQLSYGRPPCYYGGGYYGRPVYDSWGGGGRYYDKIYYRGRDDSFCEENPSTCSIM